MARDRMYLNGGDQEEFLHPYSTYHRKEVHSNNVRTQSSTVCQCVEPQKQSVTDGCSDIGSLVDRDFSDVWKVRVGTDVTTTSTKRVSPGEDLNCGLRFDGQRLGVQDSDASDRVSMPPSSESLCTVNPSRCSVVRRASSCACSRTLSTLPIHSQAMSHSRGGINNSSGEMSWCKGKSAWRGSKISSSNSSPSQDLIRNLFPCLKDSHCRVRSDFAPSLPRDAQSLGASRGYSQKCVHPCSSQVAQHRSLGTTSWFWRVTVAAVVVLVLLPVATEALTGPNVCTKQETYTSMVNVSVVKAYRVRSYTFCFSIPPKCSKYKINYKTVYKTQSQTKKRTVDVCCSGYTRVPAEDRCIPICSHDCIHGVCSRPEQCRCEAGFSGPSCNITDGSLTMTLVADECTGDTCYNISCPEGKWGMGCIHDCPCRHEGKCDPLYGNCSCHAGWIGQYCEERCPQQYYGMDCKDLCRCQNGGTCDHISGACHCPPGWTGPLCEKTCPEGTHGSACSNKCQCQNGGSCDPITGKCRCPPGWTGDVCANPCPSGTWGTNCSETCDCYNSATCDHVTGRCRCTAGYLGNKCQTECPLGTYGVNCTETCVCSNGATCSHISGRCFCKDGWLGSDCTQPACPPNQFGPGCSQICSCEAESTERCHPWTGDCECRPGWAGVTCSRACPFYKYGEKCSKTCKCENGAFCNPINGSCTCAPGYHGPLCEQVCPFGKYGQNCKLDCRCSHGNGCNHETGKCICDAGWEGLQCAVTCADDRYGSNCTSRCDCMFRGACHPETGECTCGPGHFGPKCEQTCEHGMHGTDCRSHCACVGPNVEGCDPETGRCLCKPGFRGVSCESRCSRGFYGERCDKRCDCKNDGSCHPQTGKCICERGWNGADCNTPCRPEKHGVNCNQDCPVCLHGNGTCEHTTGACVCSSGWRGARCARTCPQGHWGIECTNTCRCRNGGECRPETGECVCLPGWRGPDCSEPCEHDFFGYNCLQPCHCRNHASCRGNDGFCECLPGWMGPGCTQTCPEGYFGRQCMSVCNCTNDRFICHPVDGCKCRYGFEGDHCDQPMSSTIVDVEVLPPDPRSTFSAGIVVGVVCIIVFTCVISVVVYYRRRVKSLKRELAVVQYTANPGASDRPNKLSREPSLKEPPAPPPPPVAASKARAARLSLKGSSERPETVDNSRMSDQHHFDNPVYAYQPVSKSQPNLTDNTAGHGAGGVATAACASGGLNTIHNNLHHNHHKDTNNRHWDKLGNFTFEDDAATVGAVAGQHYDVPGSGSRKAWEADATNPNLYHSIENLKDNRLVDHVYDEIKQKTPPHQRDPGGEYDRLTYSRAVGEVKRHYYRMPSSLHTLPALPHAPTTIHNNCATPLQQPTPLEVSPRPPMRTPPAITITTFTTLPVTTTSSTPYSITQPQLQTLSTNMPPHPIFSINPVIASTGPSHTSTNSATTTNTFNNSNNLTNSLITTLTKPLTTNNSTTSPWGVGPRTSLTPSTDSSNDSQNDAAPAPPSIDSIPPRAVHHHSNFGGSGLTDINGSGKVSNLAPYASEDVYAAQKLNNLDLSLDGSSKRDAYNKFDDNDGYHFDANPFRQTLPRSPDNNHIRVVGDASNRVSCDSHEDKEGLLRPLDSDEIDDQSSTDAETEVLARGKRLSNTEN